MIGSSSIVGAARQGVMMLIAAGAVCVSAMTATAQDGRESVNAEPEPGWTLVRDDISYHGVSEVRSSDGEALVIVYCGRQQIETPTFAVQAPALQAMGPQNPATIQLVGPGDSPEITTLEGEITSGGVFVANRGALGAYHPKIVGYRAFSLSMGAAGYFFEAARGQLVNRALGRCLYW